MDNNPLSILRAQVEAATPGEWKIWRSPAGEWTARTEYRDSLGLRFTAWPAVCSAGAQPNEANAALIVTAVNLVRRMVSDEGIEQAARAYENALYGEDKWATLEDFPSGRKAACDAMRAALSSLLTGGV